MNLLLDTHAFLWFIAGDSNLSQTARAAIEDEDNSCFLSVASLWEIAIKVSLGKLELTEPFETLIPEQLVERSSKAPLIWLEKAIVAAGYVELHQPDPSVKRDFAAKFRIPDAGHSPQHVDLVFAVAGRHVDDMPISRLFVEKAEHPVPAKQFAVASVSRARAPKSARRWPSPSSAGLSPRHS